VTGNPLEDSFAQLQEATQLLQQRKFEQAQAICEALVRRYPNYVGALYTLGLVFSDQNQNEHALDCLVRASMLSPRNKQISTALAETYLRFGANEMAARILEQVKSIEPQDANALLLLGDIYQEDCEYERARETYKQALALKPDLVPAALGLGWCHSHLGDHAEAARVFEALIARGVCLLEPLRALTILPASVAKIDLLERLEKLAKAPNEDQAEFENSVEFVRAAILDRRGRHGEAWECLTRANRAIFVKMQDRMGQISERWRRSVEVLRASSGKLGRPENDGQQISLFILGASRSGKTTMERLVARLGGVKCGYESPCLRDAVLRTFQAGSLLATGLLEFVPPHLYPLCREYYLEELGRRAGTARVFTNTRSGHIHAAALMVEILPNVRFLLVKRDVEDNMLRIYMTQYRSSNDYAYDLKTAREQILQHHQMFDIMAEKFPDIVRIIQYEDLVADPAGAQSIAAELCGLKLPDEPPVSIGSDTGCAAPYWDLMTAALAR
jgi:tetratricopeptide (TPR) repeat protein